jgi:L-serine deaminase
MLISSVLSTQSWLSLNHYQMRQELAVTNRTLHEEKAHTEQRFATMGDCIRQELHINATSLRQEMFDRFADLDA